MSIYIIRLFNAILLIVANTHPRRLEQQWCNHAPVHPPDRREQLDHSQGMESANSELHTGYARCFHWGIKRGKKFIFISRLLD